MNKIIERKKKKVTEKKRIGVLTVICKLLFIYNQNLNAYAKITGIRLIQSGLTKRMIEELSLTYDSVTYKTIQTIFERFAAESETRVNAWSQEVIHCGDNLDIRKAVRHELAGRSGHELHLYNNMLFKHRVDVSNLSDEPPTPPHSDKVDFSLFLPCVKEQTDLKEHLQATINLVVSPSAASTSTHTYSAEMKQKTHKVSNYD